MIFVTVGTHEQPFDRLVKYMDRWALEHNESVIIQTGFSTFEPKNCTWRKLYPYQEMIEMVKDARIIITHGGPSSFIMPLQIGKIPIVVPRRAEFNEHVNDHQVEFCEAVAKQQENIIVVEDIEKLGTMLNNYDDIVSAMQADITSNNEKFCLAFSKIVEELME